MLLSVLFAAIFLQFSLCSKKDVKNADAFSLSTLEGLRTKNPGGIFEFNSDLLKKFSLVEHQDRNYHIFILFNALDKETNCPTCGMIDAAYKQFADIFNKKAKKGPLPAFFATIELRQNIEAFQLMGLDHVPVLMHFGPEIRAPKKYENNDPTDATKMLKFFIAQTDSKINLEEAMKAEPKRASLFVSLAVVSGLLVLIATGKISASSVFQNSYIWSIAIMGFIMTMLSGYMWVKIRNPPFIGSTPSKEALYFALSPQSQLGIESRIITGLNAITVTIFLLMIPITYKMEDNNKRRVAAMVMSLLYMASHAGLLKAFAQKFAGYPLSYIF